MSSRKESVAKMLESRKRFYVKKFSQQAGISESDYIEKVASGEKWCRYCSAFKPVAQFEREIHNCCRDCRNAGRTAWYRGDRERIKQSRRDDYATNRLGTRDRNKNYGFAKYGVEPEWYEHQLAAQDGKCAICRSEFPGGQGRFHIDHNHACHSEAKTACDNCRRGLLCSACNMTIARLESDPGWFHRAMDYLKSYGSI